MNRSEVLQEIRLMKFDDLYSRRTAGKLTQEQAAEILGISVGTMRRWEERYEAEGAEGLYDRRRGKLANNRVPADTAMEMLELFRYEVTGTTRQSISTRSWWHIMASRKATTGCGLRCNATAGFNLPRAVGRTDANERAGRWSA